MSTIGLIGKQLGDYQIHSELGQGGMAHVFKAYDPKLERYAAVKVIDRNAIDSQREDELDNTERFKREARAIANLKHPNIVGVYQLGSEEVPGIGLVYYMAQVYIEGRDLRLILKEYIKRGKTMPYVQVLRIVRDVASALDYAHANGVIHRDIKPSNIMVMHDGHAVLTDFGLAMRAQEYTRGQTFGTVHYIPPEQAADSSKAVPQSDLYSLGIVVYEMLTGHVPFDSVEGAMGVMLAHIHTTPKSLREHNPNIPLAVDDVVLRAISKATELRYASGKDFVKALETALSDSDEEDTHDLETGSFDPFSVLSGGGLSDTAPSRPSASSRNFKEVTQHHFDELERRKAITEARKTAEQAAVFENSWVDPSPSMQRAPELQAGPASGSRTPWYIAGVLALVALAALGAMLLGGVFNGASQPTATPPAQAVVAQNTPASTMTREATAQNTPVPAVISSTDAPTATAQSAAPTAAATLTTTPSPALTATPEIIAAVDEDALLLLRYDGRSIVMMNRSPDTALNINNLIMVGDDTSFEVRSLPNFQNNLPAEFCYQLWTLDYRSLPGDEFPAEACLSRRGFAQTGRAFWISEEPGAVFEVRRSGRVLGTCAAVREIDREDNRCVVDIN